jgi:hypothetical protein
VHGVAITAAQASKESNVRAAGRHEDCAGFSFATTLAGALAGALACAFASAVAAVPATALAAASMLALAAAALGVALARLPHQGTY